MKQFVANRTGAVPTLDVVNETKVKVYTNEAAIDADLANLQVGQIVGTAEQTIPDQQVVTDWMDAYMATHYPSVDVWNDITSDFTATGINYTTFTLKVLYNPAIKKLKVFAKRTDAASAAATMHGIDLTYNGTDTNITFDNMTTLITGVLYGTTADPSGLETSARFVSSTEVRLLGYNRNGSTAWPVNSVLAWGIEL